MVGSFPSFGRWAEWNGRYRDSIRRVVKGDAFAAPELFHRIEGSPDLYGERGASASINYATCHDGFTLHDLVSYNWKHNEPNGEENRDGLEHKRQIVEKLYNIRSQLTDLYESI